MEYSYDQIPNSAARRICQRLKKEGLFPFQRLTFDLKKQNGGNSDGKVTVTCYRESKDPYVFTVPIDQES